MATRTHSLCLFAATVLAPGFAASTALAAGGTGTAQDTQAVMPGDAATLNAGRVIDHIVTLLGKDELVRAEVMISEFLSGSAGVMLSDDESLRMFNLQRDVKQRIRVADPNEISLQYAKVAFANKDLAAASRHAKAVLASAGVTSAQTVAAEMLLSIVETSQSALAPQIPTRIARAVEAFDGGSYETAKAGFEELNRSGIAMSGDQSRIVSAHLGRIRALESQRGASFESGVALLSTMQPGVANRTDWNRAQSGGTQPSTQPEAAPTPQQAAPQSEDLILTARRLEAQGLLAEADAAWANADYAAAERLYGQAIELGRGLLADDVLAAALANQTEAAVMLRGNLPSGGALDSDIGVRRLARQQTDAEFSNAMQQARVALDTGDTERARNAAAQAKLTLSNGRDLYDIATYEQMMRDAENLLIVVGDYEETRRILDLDRAQKDAIRLAGEQRGKKAREVDQKINGLIQSIRAHQMERNYDKALQEVEQILFLDKNNPAGLFMRDVLQDTILLQEYESVSSQRRPSYVRELVNNWGATVAPPGLVNYPADWKNISQRRGDPMQFSESAENRSVLAALEEKRIPVDFTDNNLSDVLAFIGQVANIEMDIDWESLEDIGVSRESPVSLRLTNVPLDTVLDRVLEKAGSVDFPAGWAVTDGVLTIASDEVLRRNTVLEIYDIRDLLIEIPDYVNAPQFDLNAVFQQGGQQGGGGGGQSPFQIQQQQPEPFDREGLIEEIRNLVQENIDREGWVDFGGETGSITELNGNLVIVNTPKNHRAITGLLSKLRAVRNLQINVESRFLLINEDYFEEIGLDFDVYFANNNQFDTLRTIDPTLLPSDFFARDTSGNLVINRNVSGAPNDINGDGTITPETEGVRVQQVLQPGSRGVSDSFSPIQSAQNSLGLTRGLASGGFASELFNLVNGANGGPALSVAGRFLDDIQVDFLVEATQADRSSMTLTAPRLTLSNGQLSYTFVGTQQTFVSDLQPVVSNAAVAFDPQIGVVPDGVRLVVRGVISADRRYVTLDVTTDVASTTLGATQTSQAAAGGTGNIPGNGIATGTIQLPIVTITRVQTTVTVPDQGTLLLGGQRIVNEYITETGVPVLSKIPVLNRFFTNRIESKEEQTLLILIKPTVLIQSEEEEKNFPGLQDALGF